MSKFQIEIDKIKTDVFGETLPSYHTTSIVKLKGIIEKNIFEGQLVHPIKEKGTFLFYGKPSYNVDNAKAFDTDTFPICIIVKSEAYKIIDAFPFDSGRFNHYFILREKNYDVNDFNLNKDAISFNKIIKVFYEDKVSYYDDIIKDGVSYYVENSILSDYARHIRFRHVPNEVYDLRSRTIEIVIEDQSILSAGVVTFILPSLFKRESSEHPIKAYIEKYNLNVCYYDELGLPPSTMRNNIMIATKNYLLKEKLI